ncbi:hypothetical protein F4823DRAFT_392765 [Ustulina deusta]|nr:hypothetical protein F4823DRAFT_392765 [Ustulina deusta]
MIHIDGNSCTQVLFLQRLREAPKPAMFLSWKRSSEGGCEILTKLPVGFDPVTANKTGLQACSNCRARKVKCIWVVGGCERCKSSGRECIYETTTASAAIRARRKSKGASTGAGLAITAPADQTADATASPPAPGEARWAQKPPRRPVATATEGTSTAPSAEASLPSHTSHDTAMSESTSTPISQEATATGESSKMYSLVSSPTDLVGPEMDVDLMMTFMDSLGGANMGLLSSSATNPPGSILESNFANTDKRAACVTPTHLDIMAGRDAESGGNLAGLEPSKIK